MVNIATVDSLIQMEMVKEVLEKAGIRVLVKHRETGEFMSLYAGMSAYGIDIYVPEENAEEALALFQAFFDNNEY